MHSIIVKIKEQRHVVLIRTQKTKQTTESTQTQQRKHANETPKARKRINESANFGYHQRIILSPQTQNLINEHANYLSTM